MGNETMELGHHTFHCPLKALFAEWMVRCEVKKEDLDPYNKAIIDDGSKYFNKVGEDGIAFCGHFPYYTFEKWAEWTDFEGTFQVIECKGCDHMTIKGSRLFKATIFDTLREAIKLWG